MADLDGLALQERLSRSRREMPIIFITGYGSIPMPPRPWTPEPQLNALEFDPARPERLR